MAVCSYRLSLQRGGFEMKVKLIKVKWSTWKQIEKIRGQHGCITMDDVIQFLLNERKWWSINGI